MKLLRPVTAYIQRNPARDDIVNLFSIQQHPVGRNMNMRAGDPLLHVPHRLHDHLPVQERLAAVKGDPFRLHPGRMLPIEIHRLFDRLPAHGAVGVAALVIVVTRIDAVGAAVVALLRNRKIQALPAVIEIPPERLRRYPLRNLRLPISPDAAFPERGREIRRERPVAGARVPRIAENLVGQRVIDIPGARLGVK